MKSLLSRLRSVNASQSLFDRYYSNLVGCGSGYPTADEARQDYRKALANLHYPRWMQ